MQSSNKSSSEVVGGLGANAGIGRDGCSEGPCARIPDGGIKVLAPTARTPAIKVLLFVLSLVDLSIKRDEG